jgi:hypothetical protein
LKVHLVDGTYELFRHYFAVPKARDARGREVGAVRGVLTSLLAMLRGGVTHIGYKTGEGVEPDLLSQFPIIEEALAAAGIVVWPMVEGYGPMSDKKHYVNKFFRICILRFTL